MSTTVELENKLTNLDQGPFVEKKIATEVKTYRSEHPEDTGYLCNIINNDIRNDDNRNDGIKDRANDGVKSPENSHFLYDFGNKRLGLLGHLRDVVINLASNGLSAQDFNEWISTCPAMPATLAKAITAIENVLSFGLKDFCECYSYKSVIDRLNDLSTEAKQITSAIRGLTEPHLEGTLWLQVAMKEHKLPKVLTELYNNKNLVSNLYHSWAFMIGEECKYIVQLLEAINFTDLGLLPAQISASNYALPSNEFLNSLSEYVNKDISLYQHVKQFSCDIIDDNSPDCEVVPSDALSDRLSIATPLPTPTPKSPATNSPSIPSLEITSTPPPSASSSCQFAGRIKHFSNITEDLMSSLCERLVSHDELLIIDSFRLMNDKISQNAVNSADQLTVKSSNQLPINASDQLPVNSANQLPVNSANQLPIKIADQSLANSTNQLPTNVANQLSVNIADQSPVYSADQLPISSFDQLPVSIANKLPVNSADKLPVNISDELPVNIADQSPINIADHLLINRSLTTSCSQCNFDNTSDVGDIKIASDSGLSNFNGEDTNAISTYNYSVNLSALSPYVSNDANENKCLQDENFFNFDMLRNRHVDDMIVNLNGAIVNKNDMIVNQYGMRTSQDNMIVNQDDITLSKDDMIVNLDDMIVNLDTMIVNLDDMIANQGDIIANQDDMIINLDDLTVNKNNIVNQDGEIVNLDDMITKDDDMGPNQANMIVNQNDSIVSQNDMIVNQDDMIVNKNNTLINQDSVIVNLDDIIVNEEMIINQYDLIVNQDDMIINKNNKLVNLDGVIVNLSHIIASQDDMISSNDDVIVNQDDMIVNLDDMILNEDDTIVIQDDMIVNLDDIIANLDDMIVDKNNMLVNQDGVIVSLDDMIVNEGDTKINQDDMIVNKDDKTVNQDDIITNKNNKLVNQNGVIVSLENMIVNEDDMKIKQEDMTVNLDDMVENHDDMIVNKNNLLVNQNSVILNQNDMIISLDDMIVNLDGMIVNLDNMIVNQDDMMVNLDDMIVNKDDMVVDKNKDNEETLGLQVINKRKCFANNDLTSHLKVGYNRSCILSLNLSVEGNSPTDLTITSINDVDSASLAINSNNDTCNANIAVKSSNNADNTTSAVASSNNGDNTSSTVKSSNNDELAVIPCNVVINDSSAGNSDNEANNANFIETKLITIKKLGPPGSLSTTMTHTLVEQDTELMNSQHKIITELTSSYFNMSAAHDYTNLKFITSHDYTNLKFITTAEPSYNISHANNDSDAHLNFKPAIAIIIEQTMGIVSTSDKLAKISVTHDTSDKLVEVFNNDVTSKELVEVSTNDNFCGTLVEVSHNEDTNDKLVEVSHNEDTNDKLVEVSHNDEPRCKLVGVSNNDGTNDNLVKVSYDNNTSEKLVKVFNIDEISDKIVKVSNNDNSSGKLVTVSNDDGTSDKLVEVSNNDDTRCKLVEISNNDDTRHKLVKISNYDDASDKLVKISNNDDASANLVEVSNNDGTGEILVEEFDNYDTSEKLVTVSNDTSDKLVEASNYHDTNDKLVEVSNNDDTSDKLVEVSSNANGKLFETSNNFANETSDTYAVLLKSKCSLSPLCSSLKALEQTDRNLTLNQCKEFATDTYSCGECNFMLNEQKQNFDAVSVLDTIINIKSKSSTESTLGTNTESTLGTNTDTVLNESTESTVVPSDSISSNFSLDTLVASFDDNDTSNHPVEIEETHFSRHMNKGWQVQIETKQNDAGNLLCGKLNFSNSSFVENCNKLNTALENIGKAEDSCNKLETTRNRTIQDNLINLTQEKNEQYCIALVNDIKHMNMETINLKKQSNNTCLSHNIELLNNTKNYKSYEKQVCLESNNNLEENVCLTQSKQHVSLVETTMCCNGDDKKESPDKTKTNQYELKLQDMLVRLNVAKQSIKDLNNLLQYNAKKLYTMNAERNKYRSAVIRLEQQNREKDVELSIMGVKLEIHEKRCKKLRHALNIEKIKANGFITKFKQLLLLDENANHVSGNKIYVTDIKITERTNNLTIQSRKNIEKCTKENSDNFDIKTSLINNRKYSGYFAKGHKTVKTKALNLLSRRKSLSVLDTSQAFKIKKSSQLFISKSTSGLLSDVNKPLTFKNVVSTPSSSSHTLIKASQELEPAWSSQVFVDKNMPLSQNCFQSIDSVHIITSSLGDLLQNAVKSKYDSLLKTEQKEDANVVSNVPKLKCCPFCGKRFYFFVRRRYCKICGIKACRKCLSYKSTPGKMVIISGGKMLLGRLCFKCFRTSVVSSELTFI